jgi:hypothetical protein
MIGLGGILRKFALYVPSEVFLFGTGLGLYGRHEYGESIKFLERSLLVGGEEADRYGLTSLLLGIAYNHKGNRHDAMAYLGAGVKRFIADPPMDPRMRKLAKEWHRGIRQYPAR